MTEMTARIRNRLQDGVIDWQERRFRKTDFRQQQADIHRSRMTCSASLPAFHQTQDWTGGLTASGRIPAIEETKPKQRLISSEGIRWDAAIAALIVIGVLLLVLLAADLVSIGANGRVITRLNASVQDLEAKNAETQAKIELAAGSSSVCTEAVKLDLISSAGARTIRLTAPVNAQLTVSTAEKAAENAELEGRLTSNAGD
ncbi:MAG: hypothetical protein IKE15_11730 [Clostridia bacterium]|nr:hypothetical protein [Clostridia bacterium]MBR2664230.1 hypothetical protein [Clostridia bacterium]